MTTNKESWARREVDIARDIYSIHKALSQNVTTPQ